TLRESELGGHLGGCKAKALFVGRQQVPVVRRALAEGLLNIPGAFIIMIDDTTQPPHGMISLSALLCSRPYSRHQFNDARRAESTVAAILFSSGTAGLPKAVMLSHRNFVASSPLVLRRYLAVLPFAHVYGLDSLIVNSVAAGRTQYIMSHYSVEGFLRAIQEHRIQAACAVPSILSQITKCGFIDKYDLSTLQAVTTCSGVCVAVGETSARMSAGVVKAGSEVKIVNPATGCELGADQEGEICIRGPTVMMGYLSQPGETRRVIDGGGFLHTGDIGFVSSAGLLFITDRSKDLIKVKGLQVAPAEIEGLLMGHPQVTDAAVIGVDDLAHATEVPMALVVPKDPTVALDAVAAAELRRALDLWMKSRTANHKHLRGGIVFVDAIPRNQMGKILRRELRAQHVARSKAKL
ncbi:hypothetical protein LPJ61_003449, partial [Coemansia biformis]